MRADGKQAWASAGTAAAPAAATRRKGRQQKDSKEKERKVKGDRSLKAFVQLSSAPDMSEEVKKEFAQNIQVHDVFSADEKDDVKKEKAVKAATRSKKAAAE